MDYIELNIKINPREPFADVLTYRLSEIGFDMFEDTSEGFKAYIVKEQFNVLTLEEVINTEKQTGCTIDWSFEAVPWKNWNEEWESNFQPEIIEDKIYVRAEFHPPNPGLKYEIIVQPRMAFGTGHHPTTSQVMAMMLKIDFGGKKVLDMGSGTGILAILALQLKAKSALAIDNDSNAVENSKDNAVRNGFPSLEVMHGEADSLKGKSFDIILANINRNIILKDIEAYSEMMSSGSELICSGFYFQDLNIIRNKAEKTGIIYKEHSVESDWCCARFFKQ